jgi:hypothetical protein
MLGMEVYACDSSTQEGKAGGYEFKASLGLLGQFKASPSYRVSPCLKNFLFFQNIISQIENRIIVFA